MSLNKINYVDQETVITADNLNDIQDSIIALENAIEDSVRGGSAIEYTVTVPTDWVLEGDLYVQTISVTGLLSSDNGIVGLIHSEDYETFKSESAEWAKIHRITTSDGAIVVYATEPTTMELNIQMLVTRDGMIETEVFDGDILINGTVTPEKLDREYLEVTSVLETDNYADGSVTPEKLDRTYLETDSVLNTNNYADASITSAKVNASYRTQYFTVVIPKAGWTGSAAPFTNAVAVNGLNDGDRAKVYFAAPDDFASMEAQQEAYTLLYSIESSNGMATFYAKEKPESDISVAIEVTRI